MNLRTSVGFLFVCMPVSLVVGCSDDAKDEAMQVTSADRSEDASATEAGEIFDASSADDVSETVDSSGATLTLDTLTLIIPPGAIEEEQEVTLRLSNEGSEVPSAPYSKRYDIEPTELTLALAAAVELEVSDDPTFPVLVVHVPGKATTLIAGEVVDGKFTASIEHFGSLYLADAAELAQSEEFANDAIVIGLVGATIDASVRTDAGNTEQLADAGVPADTGADAQTSDTSQQLDAGVSDETVSSDAGESVDAAASTDSSGPDAASDADAAVVEALEPGVVPPQGYLTSDTGPFANVAFDYFYLEDFEDHDLNQPGVSASSWQLSSSFDVSIIDSVDGDDGNPSDNQCIKVDGYCDALWAAGSVTFTFNVEELGAYPTHAGAVWTDGEGEVGFEAFGLQGEIIYAVQPFSEPGVFPGVGVQSDTVEDRFFGVYSPDGITAIRLYNSSGGVEVDHLQYGHETIALGQ